MKEQFKEESQNGPFFTMETLSKFEEIEGFAFKDRPPTKLELNSGNDLYRLYLLRSFLFGTLRDQDYPRHMSNIVVQDVLDLIRDNK